MSSYARSHIDKKRIITIISLMNKPLGEAAQEGDRPTIEPSADARSQQTVLNRRDFLRRAVAGLAAVTWGCRSRPPPTVSSSTGAGERKEQVVPPHPFTQSMEALRRSDLCSVECLHPSGSSDRSPQRPLSIVGYNHPEYGNIFGKEHAKSLQRAFQILCLLQDQGHTRFYFEGVRHDPRERNFLHREAFSNDSRLQGKFEELNRMTSMAFRKKMENDLEFFHEQIATHKLQLPLLFSYYNQDNARITCSGAENPETDTELSDFYHTTRKHRQDAIPVFVKLEPLNLTQAKMVVRTGDQKQLVSVEVDGVTFSKNEVQALHALSQADRINRDSTPGARNDPRSSQHREDYMATALPDQACLLLGAGHLRNFAEYRERRSIALLLPKGIPDDVHMSTPAMRIINHFLKKIEEQGAGF